MRLNHLFPVIFFAASGAQLLVSDSSALDVRQDDLDAVASNSGTSTSSTLATTITSSGLSSQTSKSSSAQSTSSNVQSTSSSTSTTAGNDATSVVTTSSTTSASAVTQSTPTSTSANQKLPLQPEITPAVGVGGAILIISGFVLCFFGIMNNSIQIFLSTSLIVALAIEVLIIHVMNPPISNGRQGAYLVAGVLGGWAVGGFAVIFHEMAQGFGCALGGFSFAMWLLVLVPGGLVKSLAGRQAMLAIFTVLFFPLPYHRYTKHYGTIICTAFGGATALVLGADCFSKAGLKEFWIYIWDLNQDEFPLGTTSYPVTPNMKIEIACIALAAALGVMVQVGLWKFAAHRRAKRELHRQQDEENSNNEHSIWDQAGPVDSGVASMESVSKRSTRIKLRGSNESSTLDEHRGKVGRRKLYPRVTIRRPSIASSFGFGKPDIHPRNALRVFNKSNRNQTSSNTHLLSTTSKKAPWSATTPDVSAADINVDNNVKSQVRVAQPSECEGMDSSAKRNSSAIGDRGMKQTLSRNAHKGGRSSYLAPTASKPSGEDGVSSRDSRAFQPNSARTSLIRNSGIATKGDGEMQALPKQMSFTDLNRWRKQNQRRQSQPPVRYEEPNIPEEPAVQTLANIDEHTSQSVPEPVFNDRANDVAEESEEVEQSSVYLTPDQNSDASPDEDGNVPEQIVAGERSETLRSSQLPQRPTTAPEDRSEKNYDLSKSSRRQSQSSLRRMSGTPAPVFAHGPRDRRSYSDLQRVGNDEDWQSRPLSKSGSIRNFSVPLSSQPPEETPVETDTLSPLPSEQRDRLKRRSMPDSISEASSFARFDGHRSSSSAVRTHNPSGFIDVEDMTLAQRKELIKRHSVNTLQQATYQPTRPTVPRRNTLQMQPLDRVSSNPQIYDSHQPRRISTSHDPTKQASNWSSWRSSNVIEASRRPPMADAEMQMRTLRQHQLHSEQEAQQRVREQRALQDQKDAHMRMGGMQDAHRAALSRMQSLARNGAGV